MANFTELHNAIKNGGNVSFTENYTYTGEEDYKYGVPVSQFAPVIQGNGYTIDGSNIARAFNVQDKSYSLTLENATIQKAVSWFYYDPHSTATIVAAGSGGAIYNNGTFKSTDVDYIKDSSEYGGAIYNDADGNAEITGSTFSGNIADTLGGGVFNQGEMTLNDSVFTGNKAQKNGGAAYNKGTATFGTNTFTKNYAYTNGGAVANVGDLAIKENIFEANTAKVSGGALFGEGGTITIESSTFTKNKAQTGGAIVQDGAAEITGALFEGNSAKYAGGALYVGGLVEGQVVIQGSTFSSNTVKGDSISRGGAILNDGDVAIDNTLFAGNTATKYGGAIYNNANGTATISNSIFNGNKASKYGGAIFNEGTLTITDTAFKTDKDTIYSKDTEDTTQGKCNAMLIFNGVISLAGNVFTATSVKTDDGYSIVMDISSYTKKNSAYIIEDLSKFSLSSAFSINVNSAQANTTYKLAKNVSSSQTFAIMIDGQAIEKLGSVKVGQSVSYANTTFSLAYTTDGIGMTLTVVTSVNLTVAEGQTLTLTDHRYGMKTIDIKKSGTLISAKNEDPACDGYDISMASGSSKFKMAANSKAILKNLLAGNAQTVAQVTIGDFSTFSVAEEVSGVKSLSTGKNAQVAVTGQYTGTTAGDSISLGTNAIATFGNVIDLKGGKNTVSVGKGATATFQNAMSNITTLKTSDYSTLTGTTFNFSATSSSISLGKESIATLESVVFQGGNDSVKLSGAGSTMNVDKIDFGAGTDTLSIGAKASMEVKGAIEGLEKLTVSNGSATDFTEFKVQSISGGTAYANNFNIGNYADVEIGDDTGSKGIVFGSGKDSLKVGSNSNVKLGTVDFSGNTDTLSIGAKSKVVAKSVTGVTKLTLSAGSAENVKKQQPTLCTSLVVETLNLSGLKDSVTLNGYSDLTIGKLTAESGTSNIAMKDNSFMAVTGTDTDFECIDGITMGKNCVLGLNDALYKNFDPSVITKQGKNCSIVNIGKDAQATAFGGFAHELEDNYCAASTSELAGGENGWLSTDDGSTENDKYFNDLTDYFTFEDVTAQQLSSMKLEGENINVSVWTSTGGAFTEDETLVSQTGSSWSFKNAGVEVTDYRICVSLDTDKIADGIATYKVIEIA